MSEAPPPLPPPLPPSPPSQQPQQEFYFHAPPEELKPELSGVGRIALLFLHLAGLAAIIWIIRSSAPKTLDESIAIGYVSAMAMALFIGASVVFLVLRLPFKSANQDLVQPLLLLLCYGGAIAMAFSSGKVAREFDKQMAQAQNQTAVEKFNRQTRKLDDDARKELEENTVNEVDPEEMQARKEAWDKMISSVDTEGMSESDKKVFLASQEIVSEVFSMSQQYAETMASAGDLTLESLQTGEDVLAAREIAKTLREANQEMWDYLTTLPTRVPEALQARGVPAKDVKAFTQQFIQGMGYESQVAVRKLENERLDMLTLLMDLLLEQDGKWEQTDEQFLFEEDQAIEDFNVIMGEIDRIETEIGEHQAEIVRITSGAAQPDMR